MDTDGLYVTRLQYLNALMASRVGQSPDPPEIKILPNSQTKLLNDRNIKQALLSLVGFHRWQYSPGELHRRGGSWTVNDQRWLLIFGLSETKVGNHEMKLVKSLISL
ncbi:hypothetical protein PAMP_012868 [Pampus punctatissimus]